MSKFAKSFVYWTVFFIAVLKHCFIDHGKLSNNAICSCVSTVPLASFDSKSYNKYAKYWLSYLSDLTNNCTIVSLFENKSLETNSFTVCAIGFCFVFFKLLRQPAYFEYISCGSLIRKSFNPSEFIKRLNVSQLNSTEFGAFSFIAFIFRFTNLLFKMSIITSSTIPDIIRLFLCCGLWTITCMP